MTAHHHVTGESTNQLAVGLEGADTEQEIWLEREFADSNAVFSPDGRYVAYVSEQTGQSEIHIQPFPGQGAELTVSVGGLAAGALWNVARGLSRPMRTFRRPWQG